MNINFDIKPRFRVLIDNDFGGDPDGLVQLAHHLLSKGIKIPGIIVSHLRKSDIWANGSDGISTGKKYVNEILELTQQKDIPVYCGSSDPMIDKTTPVVSEGVEFMISEAKKISVLPLMIVCGGSLTQIASAYLQEPEAFKDVTVVWIGGAEHEGIGIPTPEAPQIEYNTHEDLIAAQVVFNESTLKLWQVPRNTYRQALISLAELEQKLNKNGELAEYLRIKIFQTVNWWTEQGRLLGETYCLGDSPLVLLTALQAPYEPDASSSTYKEINCPKLLDSGEYEENLNGRSIRIYEYIDTRLLFEDLFSKITLLASK